MAALLAILNVIPGLSSLINGFTTSWFKYKSDRYNITKDGFQSAAAADAKITEVVAEAEVRINALKVQVYGTLSYRIITLVAGLPPAIHFGLVYIDTILASKAFLGEPYFGVPKLPSPYDNFEWAIVSSFFLIHAVSSGRSNVSSWLNRAAK